LQNAADARFSITAAREETSIDTNRADRDRLWLSTRWTAGNVVSAATATRQRQELVVNSHVGSQRLWDAGRIVGCLLLVTLTACGGGPKASQPPPAASPLQSSPSPSAAADQQAALLTQYRTFWSSLTPVSRMPATQRRAVLAKLAVDPALKSLLAGMSTADAKGQVFYGADVPHPRVMVNPVGTTALVDDCQDSSRAGIAEKVTGRHLTVGIPRNRLSVTMKRQAGDLWKVAYVDYTKSPC
jgi:hypothetical protein